MNFWKRRRLRKTAKAMVHHARYVRNMREDVWRAEDLRKTDDKIGAVRRSVAARDWAAAETAMDDLGAWLTRLAPPRRLAGFADNLEVLVVAFVVAWACRSYFLQPFKIPTGSMQPTLYGIHSVANAPKTILDTMPLKYLKWAVTGDWYMEVVVREDGYLYPDTSAKAANDPAWKYVVVGRKRYRLPRDADLGSWRLNDFVPAGTVLWRGMKTAGDHVFVDKVRWNFSRPRRGQIMVFSTDGIRGLPPKIHYIKRLIGMPGETVSIEEPYVKINGGKLLEPDGIRRVAERNRYRIIPPEQDAVLDSPEKSIALGSKEYFVLGDNTANSRDGRYWGSVPSANTVGPAVFVYWPVSARWGPVR